mmetsp:Transcript_19338/g.41108  ORF Transcript_19338/g.41108 Transcript_19338/m.41108 type:complete len:357 (-) Transcript_19338:92-1162(-)
MGCSSSAAAKDAADALPASPRADGEADPAADGDDTQMGGGAGSKDAEKPKQMPRSPRNRGMTAITADAARSVVEACKASPEQAQFFETWLNFIFEQAMPKVEPGGRMLLVSTDMQYLELRISGNARLMLRLASRFVEACGVPDTRLVSRLQEMVSELQVPAVGLWCRLKRMGSTSPAVDAGFLLESELDWMVADLLMPPAEDQEILRDYAVREQHKPCAYGSSLLPVEPESMLVLDMGGGAPGRPPERALLSGLLVFKCLGFSRPEDAVVRTLSSSRPVGCSVAAALGPKGLTRLSLRLAEPQGKEWVPQDLANCMELRYESDTIEAVRKAVGGEATILDYAADARGYLVVLGWKC